MSLEIKVPASTSNLGAGFDSIGLALELYLELKVTQAAEWNFYSSSVFLKDLPAGTDNFIYKIASQVAREFGTEELPPCLIEMKSDIPLARGLGSSATATIAGIELADQLLALKLGENKKLEIATAIEGHPDNVAPSLMGGCVIGHYDSEVNWVKLPFENVAVVAIIPDFELKTKTAREALPRELDYQTSVLASSIANVSVAAICQQDWELLGKMMKKDLFHQPYRKALVPHYDELEAYLETDVYGMFLSGAGPAIISLVNVSKVKKKLPEWKRDFPGFEWRLLSVDHTGAKVIKT
ncbi:homoserine kinase [Sediminibacillus albus]|uniref:Homoserine kinase n=1 Tax=Sediminibacillus albus TaxID=407036 RepID=A0A1G8YYI0_9BACI|nr:homoserine kinase [Sediminibacillus albus]SDK07831.1 homoserine kinase [Sediminibacillus albus]